MQEGYVNDAGERIIPGSRRPDGTYRKDVRIRAGYVAPDEQPVYQSRGALAKQGVPKVPGMDDAEVEAAKAKPKTKSAKRNEQRKQKRAETAQTDAAAAVAAQLDAVRLNGTAAAAQPPAAVAAGQAEEEGGLSGAEKKARALRKKLKAAEALLARQAAGEQLTAPEREKVAKAPSWRAEIRELEALQ